MVIAGTASGDIECFEPGLYRAKAGNEMVDDVDTWSSDDDDLF